jgi:hypothetical protein
MKRILCSVAVAAGLMGMGMTSASAYVCSLDPTLKIGTPLRYSLNITLSTKLISADVYASGTKSTTTFGGGLGIG